MRAPRWPLSDKPGFHPVVGEWFAKNLFNEVERTKGNLAIRLHPESKVLPKLRVKDGEPLNTPARGMLTVSGQDRVLA